MTDNSELKRRITKLEAAVGSLDENVKAITLALVEDAQVRLKQSEDRLVLARAEKDATVQRLALFDNLLSRVKRIEERFVALATALNEG